MIERTVEEQASYETYKCYELRAEDWIEGENPNDPRNSVITGAPVLNDVAQKNVKVIYQEGGAAFGLIYLENQVEGQAVISIPTGPRPNDGTAPAKNITITINFAKNAASGSLMLASGAGTVSYKLVDDPEYALNNGNLNFAGLSVARERLIEDGPFQLFFYGLYSAPSYNGTFGSELIQSVQFTSSDPLVIQVTGTLDKAPLADKLGSDKAFGAQLTPVGVGSCDVTATITFNPMVISAQPTTIGYTFRVYSSDSESAQTANPDTLQEILDGLTTSSVPTIIELEGGTYAMDLVLEQKNVILRSKDPQNPAIFTGADYQGETAPTATSTFPNKAFIVRVNPSSA